MGAVVVEVTITIQSTTTTTTTTTVGYDDGYIMKFNDSDMMMMMMMTTTMQQQQQQQTAEDDGDVRMRATAHTTHDHMDLDKHHMTVSPKGYKSDRAARTCTGDGRVNDVACLRNVLTLAGR